MIEAAVVDACVAIKWVVEEPGSDRAQLLSKVRLEAPDFLLVECANILWKKVRIRDLSPGDASTRLELLLQQPVALVASRSLLDSGLALSFDLRHPVYDCIYLALALQRGVPLVTADERLARAASKQRKTAGHVILLADLSE